MQAVVLDLSGSEMSLIQFHPDWQPPPAEAGSEPQIAPPTDDGSIPVVIDEDDPVSRKRVTAVGETTENAPTVLVIEDDSAMRVLFEMCLNSFGYCALVACDGDDALRLAAGRSDIRLIIMDVVMPGLSGQRLVDEVKIARPGVRILFCSGHSIKVLSNYGIELAAGQFLQKPWRPADLKRKMEELLPALNAC